jgi:DNA polymerase
MTVLHIDYETASPVELRTHGLDRYLGGRGARVLMAGYAFDHDEPKLWLPMDRKMPAELREGLEDPEVEKWAFNAQFEVQTTERLLDIRTPLSSWRCTMALAYLQSFAGDLAQIGRLLDLDQDKQKLSEGKRLINLFTKPQKITKNQPHEWRDEFTDPEDWQLFGDYCKQDVVAEREIKNRLIKFPIPEDEWELWAIDQEINQAGLPIDLLFVDNAYDFAVRRKKELTELMRELTGLKNPNSGPQMLPWLKARGYWFDDLRKDTVKKVLTEDKEDSRLDEDAVAALKLRQKAAKTSHTKLRAIQNRVGSDDLLRFTFQFAGAQRTARWAGRGFQPHNLVRTPKIVAKNGVQEALIEAVRADDYDFAKIIHKEPMDSITGSIRAAIRAPDGYELRVCDLAAIETRVTGWLSSCRRLMDVFANGKDPYIDFGQDLYQKAYAEITPDERQNSKPAVLGCTYRLGGGELKEGKRTGLWGYAESMGVNQSKQESHRQVRVFRESYPEIPKLWFALEDAVKRCIREHRDIQPWFKSDGRKVMVPVTMIWKKPYMMIRLPSGRHLYYHKPRIEKRVFQGRDGEPYTKEVFSYMGRLQNSNKWGRVNSHGGKITENLVQAIARDVLKAGIISARKAGFDIRGHVHDEIIVLVRKLDNFFTMDRLRDHMRRKLWWAPDLLLDAAGYVSPFYKKD